MTFGYSITVADDINEMQLNTNRLKVLYNTVNVLYDTIFSALQMNMSDKDEANMDTVLAIFAGYHLTSRAVIMEYKFQNQKYKFDKIYNVFLKDYISLTLVNDNIKDMNDVIYRFISKILNADSVSEITPIAKFLISEYSSIMNSLANEIVDLIYELQQMIEFERGFTKGGISEFDMDDVENVYDKAIIPDIDPSDKEYENRLFDELVKREEELIELIKKANEE